MPGLKGERGYPGGDCAKGQAGPKGQPGLRGMPGKLQEFYFLLILLVNSYLFLFPF